MAVSVLRMRPSSKILGASVENVNQDDLGRIENLIVDEETGKIVYVVLATKELLGLRTSYRLLPWHFLRPGTQLSVYVADISSQMLQGSPALDEDRMPDISSPEWNRKLHEYWGLPAYWEAGRGDHTPVTGSSLPDTMG